MTTRANSGQDATDTSVPPSSTRLCSGFAISLASTASGLESTEFESLQPDHFFLRLAELEFEKFYPLPVRGEIVTNFDGRDFISTNPAVLPF
ncbi:MAG TPA: hypothetical protein VK737_02695 [Opitutales bacterium]|nr:hypothetical protein [Opitutales bacterium]